MREIEFRAKTTYNNEWVYGYYRHVLIPGNLNGGFNYDCHKIYDPKGNRIEHDVEEDTVGQYIGLKDKNVIKVFEGDIVRQSNNRNGVEYIEDYLVVYDGSGFCKKLIRQNEIHATGSLYWFNRVDGDGNLIKEYIIGNIHDNPELLERVHD